MFKEKRYLSLNSAELHILIQSLLRMRNSLIHQGRCTDCVDELLAKILS